MAVTAGEQHHTETWSRDRDAGWDEVAVLFVATAPDDSGRSKDGQTDSRPLEWPAQVLGGWQTKRVVVHLDRCRVGLLGSFHSDHQYTGSNP